MFRQWSVCSSTIKDGIVKNQNYHEVGLHPSQQQPSHRADAKLLVVVCTCRAEVFQDVVNLDIAALLAFSENCIGLVLRTNSKTMNGTWTVDNLNLFLDFGRFRAQRGWLWLFGIPAWRRDCGIPAGRRYWLVLGRCGLCLVDLDTFWDFGVAELFLRLRGVMGPSAWRSHMAWGGLGPDLRSHYFWGRSDQLSGFGSDWGLRLGRDSGVFGRFRTRLGGRNSPVWDSLGPPALAECLAGFGDGLTHCPRE